MNRKVSASILLYMSISTTAMAEQLCDSILQYGIFDKNQKLDEESKFNLYKNTYCKEDSRSTDTSIGLEYKFLNLDASQAKQINEKICKSSYNEFKNDSSYQAISETASKTIVNAWETCIRLNTGGVSHFITPVDDKNFVYKIHVYKSLCYKVICFRNEKMMALNK